MAQHPYSVVHADGRVDHPVAPSVRQGIASLERRIGAAFAKGNIEAANYLCRELYSYKEMNARYLVPTRPAR